jgi:hypothetical protein
MPEGEVFTKEEVAYMLEAPSLPSPDQKAKKKSRKKVAGQWKTVHKPYTTEKWTYQKKWNTL